MLDLNSFFSRSLNAIIGPCFEVMFDMNDVGRMFSENGDKKWWLSDMFFRHS